jgi:hypothetical protein
MYNLHPPKWQVYAVLLIVFTAILWFLPSPEKWLTFGLFATILAPVTYSMLKKRKVRTDISIYPYEAEYYEAEYVGIIDPYNIDSGYIPGIRDFSGEYIYYKK